MLEGSPPEGAAQGHAPAGFLPATEEEILLLLQAVKFGPDGLVSAVAVDADAGDLLMLAHMNRESLALTLKTGNMTYWSRSRKSLWVKGETSGNTQTVVSASIDCDGDALLFRVRQQGLGAACHEGYRSCFFRLRQGGAWVAQGSPLTPCEGGGR